MKQLFIIRHAKSSWENFSQQDFDRPLNERGKKDAAAMAKRLKEEKEITINMIVSSPAKRALSTAILFAEAFNIKKKKILKIPELYEPAINAFFTVIDNLNDNEKAVAIFSHNPAITAFVNELTNIKVDDMPTCAAFAVRVLSKEWKNFKDAEKEFWFFDYPKNTN